VIVRDTGDFAGWVALDEHGGDDALGYRLLRAQWGRGLATEAVRAVLLHAFERVGLASVAGITMAVNLRSRRVMERSGMHLSKIVHADPPLPLPGSEEGEAVYSAERDDWLAAHRLTARDGGKT
jgi:RimJ/RimL family protein N-acetyltransferase